MYSEIAIIIHGFFFLRYSRSVINRTCTTHNTHVVTTEQYHSITLSILLTLGCTNATQISKIHFEKERLKTKNCFHNFEKPPKSGCLRFKAQTKGVTEKVKINNTSKIMLFSFVFVLFPLQYRMRHNRTSVHRLCSKHDPYSVLILYLVPQ